MKRPEHNHGTRETPDADLVSAARRGDKLAFIEIVSRHQAMVCGLALGILKDFAASEDAAQEAFLTAWRKIHDLREPAKLRSWLGQVARTTALGHLRRRKGHDSLDDVPDPIDETPPPDDTAATKEETQLVRESLAKLPETYRLPLILFYRENQSVRAVAEALDISEDAAKQRLARGRELLRDRMSGLVETVLHRTQPTAVFTMTIAAAIGALAAPAAIAGAVFAGAATASTAATTSTPLLAAMSSSKPLLVTTALVAVACVPIGYQIRAKEAAPNLPPLPALPVVRVDTPSREENQPPSFEASSLFAEWRALHEEHGTTANAMPALFKAISDIKDPVRRRSFRAALVAEWVQLDPPGGLRYFLENDIGSREREQFFLEWLALDPRAAVDALLSAGKGWEQIARATLTEIAEKDPWRVRDVVSRLPKSDNYWDTKVTDAFAVVAETDLAAAREAAETVKGPNRLQALAGVAQTWARSDFQAVLDWARELPGDLDQDEIVRLALIGRAAVDPIGALESVGIVPAGGRDGYFASTTAARVLRKAVEADFDGTIAWITAHPGRFGYDDLSGIAGAVTERLNADPVGFIARQAESGTLDSLLPAVGSALLNDAGGQKGKLWDWIQTQPPPPSEPLRRLQENLLSSAAYQDPELALRFATEIPTTPEGDKLVHRLAQSLWNGGNMLHRFDTLMAQAPDRLRGPLVESVFGYLSSDSLENPQEWIERLALLPADSIVNGIDKLARAWAGRSPEEAIDWLASMAPGDTRASAVASVTSTWAETDAYRAAEWVGTMAPGSERDQSTLALVRTVAKNHPSEAWDWAMTIDNTADRGAAAAEAVRVMAQRDVSIARQWIATGPFTPETRADLERQIAEPQ